MNWARWRKAMAVAVMVVMGTGMVCAEEYGTSDRTEGRLRKLGRGLANVLTFPLEIIRTPELVSRREGYLAGATIGLAQGVWRAGVRGATGLYEVVTFYSDAPNGYQPIMKPEFVWENGHWTE